MPVKAATNEEIGGRIFFSGAERSLVEEDEIRLTSVGVDIGSSTSHLMFSRITLERLDTRYVVSDREVLFASDIFLTPYAVNDEIDTDVLAAFIEEAYKASGIRREDVDTGALILTGVAVRRRNARAIGELFASEAGKFVAVSAGDHLETIMAAHGSGAVAASETGRSILNIDIGGGTTKLALCKAGEVVDLTAVEAGARLVATDDAGVINRLERFGALALGEGIGLGDVLSEARKSALADQLAERICAAIDGTLTAEFRRLGQMDIKAPIDGIVVSGGVSEYFYDKAGEDFGDIGSELAKALRQRLEARGVPILPHLDGIRATVVGASQYTVQVSGSTIFFDPAATLPMRNIPVIAPPMDLPETIVVDDVAAAVAGHLDLYNLGTGDQPVALALHWTGSASFHRLDALARGLIAGLAPILAQGHPLAIVADGDIGGLLGLHVRENDLTANPIVSIDGIELSDFDFVDIGEVLSATGSVPVVVKSLVFPGEGAAGKQEDAA
jgi:ethanolamine utilization protein EutA